MTGPVDDVLTTGPSTGPVRIITLAQDANGHPRFVVTTAPDRAHAAAAVIAARAVPGAMAVTVDHRSTVADVANQPAPSATPSAPTVTHVAGVAAQSNDTYRSSQWALSTLQAEGAWALHNGTGSTVAVIDTGVDGTHPDLAGHILPGIDELGQYPDGRTDPEGHGTHVAGIIDAIANNGAGVAGLADGAQILPIRVLDATGSGYDSDIANGIIWATDHGATVINMSLAGTYNDPTLASAVAYAQGKNVVVVAAAGNAQQSGNPVEYPAADPGVVAVAATDQSNAAASFSERGPQITLAAPGVGVLSTYPVAMGSYATMSGTSMASPYAAAEAALIHAAAPTLSATGVINEMVTTTTDLGTPGRDDVYGAGLINPVAALQATLGSAQPALPGAPGSVTADPGDGSATVSWNPATANGSPITGYILTASPGGATATTGATTATVTGLTDGTAYTFTVTATNAVGTGPASSPSPAITPVPGPQSFWSPATGTHVVQGELLLAYQDLGGPTGSLGYPITGLICGLRGGGCGQVFQTGRIYISTASGTHAVSGDVGNAWISQGAEGGPVGYPTSDLICGLAHGGCGQLFQNGRIYTSSGTGAHIIDGDVGNLWLSQGAEGGPLGYPTSDLICGLAHGGCGQLFQNGRIYTTTATGAHAVSGAVGSAWLTQGAEGGPLGYPTAAPACGLASGGCKQTFQGGTIYWQSSAGTNAVSGGIAATYSGSGADGGPLGYPSSGLICGLKNSGCGQLFQNGRIYTTTTTGAHSVSGPIGTAWLAQGAEGGSLGYPTSEPYAVSGGTAQDFQGGRLFLDSATGSITKQ